MSKLGRELDYQHWNKDTLVASLMQAEDDLKDAKADLVNLERERDQYYLESRESARILGGIVRLLRDGDVEIHGSPVRRQGPHLFYAGDHLGGGVCACGAQWLVAADRCVMQG